LLGKGAYAKVIEGFDVSQGKTIAVKAIDFTNLSKDIQSKLEREIQILRKIQHPNIIALFDSEVTPNRTNLIFHR
jgi:serine/threonine protein kinase